MERTSQFRFQESHRTVSFSRSQIGVGRTALGVDSKLSVYKGGETEMSEIED